MRAKLVVEEPLNENIDPNMAGMLGASAGLILGYLILYVTDGISFWKIKHNIKNYVENLKANKKVQKILKNLFEHPEIKQIAAHPEKYHMLKIMETISPLLSKEDNNFLSMHIQELASGLHKSND